MLKILCSTFEMIDEGQDLLLPLPSLAILLRERVLVFFISIKSPVLYTFVPIGLAAIQGWFLPQAEKALVSSPSRSMGRGGRWRSGLVSSLSGCIWKPQEKPCPLLPQVWQTCWVDIGQDPQELRIPKAPNPVIASVTFGEDNLKKSAKYHEENISCIWNVISRLH